MPAQTVATDEKTTLNHKTYDEIRLFVRDKCGFMAELAATEVLDNALRHGKKATVSLNYKNSCVELRVINACQNHNPSKIDPGGFGLKIIKSLRATGDIKSFSHHVSHGWHYVTLVMPVG